MSHKPDPSKNVNLTINGLPVTVPEGTRILEAAKKVNVHIPTLCEHPDLCKRALCRICVVEADGRGKLIAACANDVWEGVNIVTNNLRLLDVRKTILELILANHPQDCLTCVRNTKCELQSLAVELGVRESPFERTAEQRSTDQRSIENETLVRDMGKCVKCARCVEACQETQTIRAINTSGRSHEFAVCAPYKMALDEGQCVFCGSCAEVCPVGAIYAHYQTAQVWESLRNSERRNLAQVSPAVAAAMDNELGLAAGTVTTGKIVAALRLLGFNQVYDALAAINDSKNQFIEELDQRINNDEKYLFRELPMISGCSDSVYNFICKFYRDLIRHYAVSCSPRQVFTDLIKDMYTVAEELIYKSKVEKENVITVSFVPCIAQKYNRFPDETDFALTPAELARMIKTAGIDVAGLPEDDFDDVELLFEDDAESAGSTIEPLIVHGFAEAHKVMESIRKGECDAKWVEIKICGNENCCR